MVSTYTANKGLEQPAHGDYSGNWDVPLNNDMGFIDSAFGGSTSLNATSGSATLTLTQYRSLIINVSGTISSNVTYTIPSGVGGQWLVYNAATGANVYFRSAAGGATVQITSASPTSIYCDGTSNGMRILASGGGGGVTSVNASGGSTGLSFSGGPITTSGTLTLAGTLGAGYGGTGLNTTPTNGQIPIGNGAGYTLATLTAGSGVTITNASGGVTIATSAAGTVTSVATGVGLTGGPIVTTGTISLNTTAGGIGTYVWAAPNNTTTYAPGSTIAGSALTYVVVLATGGVGSGAGVTGVLNISLSGTWQAMTPTVYGPVGCGSGNSMALWIRIA